MKIGRNENYRPICQIPNQNINTLNSEGIKSVLVFPECKVGVVLENWLK